MNKFYIYLLIMTVATLSLRMLPILILKKPITNKFIKSFLYYVPYITLSVMTFPAILNDTTKPITGLFVFILAIILAIKDMSIIKLTTICCLLALILEILL